MLKKYNIKGNAFELELTETAIMQNPIASEKVLKKLSQLKLKIVIDDFGMGYSSLSRLKQLPISTLKIDKSFIHDVTADPDNRSIVRSTIALASALGLDVIAEGIETVEQLRFLLANGCEQGQGFYLSRPILADEMEALLKQQANENAN